LQRLNRDNLHNCWIRLWRQAKTSPDSYTPELGLDVGVRLKDDLHRRASALAGDALGFGPSVLVAGGFDGHDGSLGGSDFQAQRSIGGRGLDGELRMSKPLPVIPANSSYG